MVAPYIDHGTQLMQLKPSSILAAAEEDVVRFRRNTIPASDCQAYAFHRMHVRRVLRKFPLAMGSDIIRIALTAWSVAVLLPGEGRHGSMKAAGWGNTQHGRLIAAPALVSN